MANPRKKFHLCLCSSCERLIRIVDGVEHRGAFLSLRTFKEHAAEDRRREARNTTQSNVDHSTQEDVLASQSSDGEGVVSTDLLSFPVSHVAAIVFTVAKVPQERGGANPAELHHEVSRPVDLRPAQSELHDYPMNDHEVCRYNFFLTNYRI